jgi:RHS repeat-associated protein
LDARYYDSSRGQFITEDPVFLQLGSQQAEKLANRPLRQILGDPQGLNSYSYAENNPITVKDPSGLTSSNVATVLGLYAQVLNLLSQIVVQLGGGGGGGSYNPIAASAAMLAHSTTIDPQPVNITPSNQQYYGNIVNQIQKSSDFNTYVKKEIKDDGKNGSINVPANPSHSLNFNQGDLFTSLHAANVGLSGKQSADGSWNIHVNMQDTYNFDPKNYGSSYSGAAVSTINNAAYIGQQAGIVSPYQVSIKFDYTYKTQ